MARPSTLGPSTVSVTLTTARAMTTMAPPVPGRISRARRLVEPARSWGFSAGIPAAAPRLGPGGRRPRLGGHGLGVGGRPGLGVGLQR
ncbi:MAG: hypothetical protein R2704_07680 [Microthrixaceae bacterium]